ncbi:hybrid sensor histidine kinase/response regulator transcription factor [Zobellia uliginosa]|uniref:hybrid sensor histidine kinase/response regulator transcription factor n=1 Tax=Zobellia uliginosa TaxID=143224 RepID=UPI0026E12814|nr:two-component regulator propeller domain-containing protein [Zobellia uliginosa]MDO6519368.1 two-component regulator propeller domain-containing protein [Zobellia uliginosa]
MTIKHYYLPIKMLLVVLAVLFLPTPSFSQKTEGESAIQKGLAFNRFFAKDGLPDNRVRSIYQDKKGFIWIGTMNGLCRYDGYNFKQFSKNVQGNGIAGNWVYAIAEDEEENIWIGSTEGLSKIERNKDSILNFKTSDFLPHKEIKSLYIDQKQRLWIGTKKGLSILEIKTGKVHQFKDYPLNNAVNVIVPDEKGHTWVSCETGIVRFDEKNLSQTYFPFDVKPNAYNDRIWDILFVQDELWVASGGDGIYRSKTDSLTAHGGSAFQKLFLGDGVSPNLEIYDLTMDNSGDIWLGTTQGLGKIERQTPNGNDGPIIFYQQHYLNDYSLSNDRIFKLNFDAGNNLWIGSNLGLSTLLNRNRNFSNFSFTKSTNKDEVRGITAIPEGDLWYTTSSKGTSGISNEDGTIKKLGLNMGPEANMGRCIASMGQKLFIGSLDGLVIKDLKTGYVQHLLPGKNVFSLLLDTADNKAYIGTISGLFAYDMQKNTLASKLPLLKGFVRSLYKSPNGTIYAGIDGPFIYKKDPEGDFAPLAIPDHFFGSMINAMEEDNEGHLWIGTESGLNKLTKNGSAAYTCELIGVGEGLADKSVHGLIIDKENNLWISSIKGLMRYSDKEKHFEYFLPNLIFSPSCFYKKGDTAFFFGHANGFIRFDPKLISFTKSPPDVLITGFRILNKAVKVKERINGDVILDKQIFNTENITLNYKNDMFTLEYANINGSFEKSRDYAYKLEGFDNDWVYNKSEEHTATYTNLNPGTYTFIVKAKDHSGSWNSKPTKLSISVLPPPWKTWWAILTYVAIINGLIYIFIRYRTANARKESELLLEKREKEQMKELNNLKLQFFTNISHEFRTPLTLISGPIKDIISNNTISVDIRKKAKIIKRNSDKLIHLIDELITFRKLEKGGLVLKPTTINILHFVQEISESFQLFAEGKEVIINCHSLLKDNVILADPIHLYKAINNLMANALKFCSEGSVVQIKIKAQKKLDAPQKEICDSWIRISVSNSGPNISKENLVRIFDRYYKGNDAHGGTGIGLSLAKELVELHNGSIHAKSDHQTTEFTILLPKGNVTSLLEDTNTDPASFPKILALDPYLGDDRSFDETQETTYGEPGKMHILLVDDNNELLEYLSLLLKDDFIIKTASNGLEALEVVEKTPPDVIVSDVLMPKMDGYGLCQSLKENRKTLHIPVILLTAKTMTEEKMRGLHLGADAYLEKPFDPDILKTRIHALVKSRKMLIQKLVKEQVVDSSAFTKNPIDEAFIQKVVEHITANLDNGDFSVEELSEKMSMSRSNLFRKVKTISKMSPVEFIYYIRLQNGMKLLLERKFNISEIAWQVGFKNPSSFSKSFKKQYGKSPTEYLNDRLDNG